MKMSNTDVTPTAATNSSLCKPNLITVHRYCATVQLSRNETPAKYRQTNQQLNVVYLFTNINITSFLYSTYKITSFLL